MTTPHKPGQPAVIPEGAYVGTAGQSNSLVALNDVTEESAKQSMQTPVMPTFNGQRNALWGMLDQVAAAITGRTPAGHPLEFIENWLAEDRANTGRVLADYGDILERKVEPWAVPTIMPLSATINRRADPTFQLSDMMVPIMSGTTSQNSGHTHTVATSPEKLRRGGGALGRTYFAFITPAINRAYEQLNFMVSEVSAPAARMDVAIYVVNPEDRSLIRQVLVTDAAAGLPFAEAVATVTFPRWAATQGSYVCVAFLQHGAGNPRSLLGLDDTPRPLTNVVFPRKISAIHPSTGMTTLAATIDGETQVDFESIWFAPYAELSEAVGVEYRVFMDSFNVPSNRNIDRPWIGLTSNEIRVTSDGWAGITASAFIALGPRVAVYDTPLSTDRVQVSGRALNTGSHVGPGSWSFLALRATNNMSTGVGVFYSMDTIQIRSWSANAADQIYTLSMVRASTPWSLPAGETREFTAIWEDGEVSVYDESNTAILSWTDTVTQQVARHRFVGIGFQRISGASSPRLDHWAARDLPPTDAVPEEED